MMPRGGAGAGVEQKLSIRKLVPAATLRASASHERPWAAMRCRRLDEFDHLGRQPDVIACCRLTLDPPARNSAQRFYTAGKDLGEKPPLSEACPTPDMR